MAGREGSGFIGEGTMLEKLEHYIVQERFTKDQVSKVVTSQRARRAVIPVTSMTQPAHISKEHDNRTGTLTSLPRSTVLPSSKFNVTDVTLSDISSGSKSFKYRFLDDCASGIPEVSNSTQMILGSLYDGHTVTPALMPASTFTKASGLGVSKTSISADCMRSPKPRMILPPASSTGHDGSLNQDLASLQTNQERDLTIPRIPPATCPVTDVRRAASSAAHSASYPSSGCRSIKRPNEDNRSSTVYPRHSRRHASIEYSRNSTSQIASANDISIHFPSKKTISAHLGAVQQKKSKKSNCTKVNALLSLGNVDILQTRHLLNDVAPITQKLHMLRESIPADKIATPSAKVYLSKKEAVTPSALGRTTRSDGTTYYKRTFQHRGQRLKISNKDQRIIANGRELGSSWAISEPAEPSGDITGGTREAITVGIFQSTEPDIEMQDVKRMDYQGTRRRALPKVVLHPLKFRISEVNRNGTQIYSNTLDTDSSISKFPSNPNDDSGELLTPVISESDRSNCQRNLISGRSNDSEHHSDSSEATISADEIESDNLSSKSEKINHSTDQDTDQQPFNPPLSPPNSVRYRCNVDLNDDCSSQSYPECLRIGNDFSGEKSGSFETTGSSDSPWTDQPPRSISDFSKDNCPPPSDPEVGNDLDRQPLIQQNNNCIGTLEEAWSGSFGISDGLIASEPEHPCYEGHSDPVRSYSDEVESNTTSYSSTSDSDLAVAFSRATCSLHEVVSDISTDIEDNRDVFVVGAECDTSSGGEMAGPGNMPSDKSTIFGDVSHTEGIDLPADLSLLRGTDKLRVLRERMLRREKEINQLVNNHQQME